MKKYIICILMCFALVGCRTQKQSSEKSTIQLEDKTKSNITVNNSQVVDRSSDFNTSIESSVSRWLETNLKKNTEVSTTTYDTDKPILPETGKPPVKSETNTKTSTEISNIEQQYTYILERQQELIREVDSIRNVVKDLSDYNVKLKTQLEEKKSSETGTKLSWWWIIIPIGFAIFVFLLWRIFSNKLHIWDS
ncbi:hypothetical protein AGMMS49525_10330 [Bacteroidia bacterium]|nr:hypothetical protein AGMMS49525_10330 [Bacteroidia bacterium]